MARRPCIACRHPQVAEIDDALRNRTASQRQLAEEYGLSESNINKHARFCLGVRVYANGHAVAPISKAGPRCPGAVPINGATFCDNGCPDYLARLRLCPEFGRCGRGKAGCPQHEDCPCYTLDERRWNWHKLHRAWLRSIGSKCEPEPVEEMAL